MRANKPSERVFSLALTQRRRAMHLSWRTHCETGSVSLRARTLTQGHARARAYYTRAHTPGPGCERTLAQSASERTCLCTDARCSCALAYAPVCTSMYVHRRVGTGPTRGPEARSNSQTVDTDLTQRPAAVHTVVPLIPPRRLPPWTPFLSSYTACQKSRKNSPCLQSARVGFDDGERRCWVSPVEISAWWPFCCCRSAKRLSGTGRLFAYSYVYESHTIVSLRKRTVFFVFFFFFVFCVLDSCFNIFKCRLIKQTVL